MNTFLHKYVYVGTAMLIMLIFGHVFQIREDITALLKSIYLLNPQTMGDV
jgi:hypothetical protein